MNRTETTPEAAAIKFFYCADLRGADFSGQDLRGASFTGADLRGADFSGADLTGVSFFEADLRGADLRGACVVDSDFRGAKVSRAKIDDAFGWSSVIYRDENWSAGQRRKINAYCRYCPTLIIDSNGQYRLPVEA